MTAKIGVILGTAREESLGGKIFKYLKDTMKDSSDIEYTWINLRDYPLPLYDHPETPLEDKIQNLSSNEEKWIDTLSEQDGFVIMTPEYDRAISGALKNALDYVGGEVARKPVQVVAYSHFSDGGIVAAASIVPILQMLSMIVLPSAALLWNADPNFTDDGELVSDVENSDHFASRLKEVFHEIDFYTQTLKANPYK
ncbi:NADPH-dependent FMN reductase [Companilactobacillus mishanensis]|uniref:NADPH-dependent FMN reductase n=1 Tax=Companilactobacillus mishanensis TaxID=2486008 RepID=UPI0012948B11|nr:NAD(P)H-dependent oxidoreductase [Companilactobacillus mishanensis]MQS89586.1 NAD(P)H-dependent oxidoreductase [Companilactobacillus mishanensis]